MKIKYIALCLLLALVGCQREEDITIAKLTFHSEHTEAFYYDVEVSCMLDCNAPYKRGFVHYATSSDFADYQAINADVNKNGKCTAKLTDLDPDKTYYIRFEVSNNVSSVYTKEYLEVRTMALSAPVVTTQFDSIVTYNSAEVGGKIRLDGGLSIMERGVVYATTQEPTTSSTKVVAGSGTGSFTCDLTDLQDGTTYYVRAYATNEKGTAYGKEVSFTTKTKTIATIVTTLATNVSYTSATVGGNVTDDGGVEVFERGVVYATTQEPTTSSTKVVAGSGTGSFTCDLTDLQDGTTYYVRAYAMNEKGTAYGDEVSFTTKERYYENGHEYVDLGLSVKWATMNVGASKAEEYGDYFAWGEIEPKDYYDWGTYKWCNGSASTLTKYNTSSSYGTVDNKTQLDLIDDAAYVNWGGAWRMPTDAELTELRNNCTWTWISQNGVNGYKVTSKSNGNSIFLPAAGYRGASSLVNAGYNGYYWSSSLHTDYSYCAWHVSFYSRDAYGGYYTRFYGLPVRPVCP